MAVNDPNALLAANPMMAMMQWMQMMQTMLAGLPPSWIQPGALGGAAQRVPPDPDPGLDAPKIRPTSSVRAAGAAAVEPFATGTILDALFLSADGRAPLGGIPRGATIAFVGPPGKGKTRTALAAIARAALDGKQCALVVAEEGFRDMTPTPSGRDDLCSRLTKIAMSVASLESEQEVAAKILSNVYVMESQYHRGQTWDDFVNRYSRLVDKAGIDFVVIDSLQMLDPTRQHAGDNLSALKIYNRAQEVTCLCIGQIRDSGEPVGGTSLEHAADAVLTVRRMTLWARDVAAFWGAQPGETIDVVDVVRSALAPAIQHPTRVVAKPGTGELVRHEVQPARYRMGAAQDVRVIEPAEVRSWLERFDRLSEITRSIGRRDADSDYLEDVLHLPLHLQFVIKHLVDEEPDATVERLASAPFYSLCRGLFLPLSSMAPERAATIFGFASEEPPDTAGRDALLARFLEKDVGLTLVQKLACILGDPFEGRASTFRRDSLVRLLLSTTMIARRAMLDRLAHIGDVAALFAESRPALRASPPLTATEVLLTLRYLPEATRTLKFDLLRSLLARCGKLEAYFLAKLVLRKAGFGFDYQGGLIARALAEQFGAPPEQVAHAMALTDAFHVADVLAREGAAGLRKIQLQPLVAVPPALASGTTEEIKKFPVWVERKYDGIRFMLHKSTDAHGAVLCAAYTRGRRDWLELVPRLDTSIKMLPARNCIVDGELYGTVVDIEGARPASVYEVYAGLQGERVRPVNMRFAAFDLIYVNGTDLTRLSLAERRNRLAALLAPLGTLPLPVPIALAEGQLAQNKDDVSRLYHHFRSQGYEGIISKDLSGAYALGARDPSWLKRKPELTLDLVLLGGVFAVTEKKSTGLFGSYVIGARTPDGGYQDVGDVAGVDRERDAQIQHEIMREGLLTGRRIERQSASGVRPGVELRPHIVVTVRFEGIVREGVGEEPLRMRDPKLVVIRADKVPMEANTTRDLEEIYLRQRVG